MMKPALSEIFAAMNGVVCAGVAVVKEGHSTSHPLADLSVRAAKLQYDVRARLLQAALSMPVLQDNIAKTCLAFLNDPANRKIMEDNKGVMLCAHPSGQKGGSVNDVAVHIDDMAVREARVSGKRRVETLNGNGGLSRAFPAAYLPSHHRPVREEGKAKSRIFGAAIKTSPVPPVHVLS